MFVTAGDERLTLPDGGVMVSQEPLAMEADQFKACGQVPLAVMLACWDAGLGRPSTPAKLKAAGATAMAQGGSTVKFTGMF